MNANEFFSKYTSNTLGGSGNQTVFRPNDPDEICVGRVCYKIFASGKYAYSFLFSNTVDSTFSDGSRSKANHVCPAWKLHGLSVAFGASEATMSNPIPLTVDGEAEKTVCPGELFATDPVTFCLQKGDLLRLEIAFLGKELPCHEEIILPTFILQNDRWVRSAELPVPSMVGCDRTVQTRVAFWGDSITQGIGTDCGSYTHWNAILAEMLGTENAFWNLGLGFARAEDAASDGIWMQKALQNDAIVLCLGCNDLLQGREAFMIENNLRSVVRRCKREGKRVLLQTLPPFDYCGKQIETWNEVNRFLREELSKECDAFFDVVPTLQKAKDTPHLARYGGHPNQDGCAAWAHDLAPVMKEFLS